MLLGFEGGDNENDRRSKRDRREPLRHAEDPWPQAPDDGRREIPAPARAAMRLNYQAPPPKAVLFVDASYIGAV